MTSSEKTVDAYMDPWCVVPLITGDHILFGFAIEHAATGGLSWVRSTPIRYLNEDAGRATTASGRHYKLGRRIDPEGIPMEGDEAWLAYDLLISPDADDDVVPPLSADSQRDAEWIAACKMARHLRVTLPVRAPVAVQEFMRLHTEAYLALRALGRRN